MEIWRWLGIVVGGLLVLASALWVTLIVSMRRKYIPVLGAVRRLNRALWNRRAMRVAGRPGAYASVIRHVGRSSGTHYETPVGVVATEGGFVITLPYGTTPDWLKNVLAAGSATIIHEGSTYEVDAPRVVSSTEVIHLFSPRDQRINRWYGVDDFLVLRRSGDGQPGAEHRDALASR